MTSVAKLVPEVQRGYGDAGFQGEMGLEGMRPGDPVRLSGPDPSPGPDSRQGELFNPFAGWPRPSKKDPARRGPAKRRPTWAYPGYCIGVGGYLEYHECKGGSTSGPPHNVTQAIKMIKEYRVRRLMRHDREVTASLADCGRLWYGSPGDGARPCGCGDSRLCPLCQGAAAAVLARDGNAFMYDEFVQAVQGKGGVALSSYGAAYELPAHKAISKALEVLLLTKGSWVERTKVKGGAGWVWDNPAWRKQANRLATESWAVVQGAHPEGSIGGNQSIQLYGESDPSEPHFHTHNTVAPAVLVGDVWENMGPEVQADEDGRMWFAQKDVRVPGRFTFRPLSKWLDDAALECMRLDWGHRQCLAAIRLGLDPVADLGAEKRGRRWHLVGDVHRSYFGWRLTNREGGPLPVSKVLALKVKALDRAKAYLAYQSRWPGADLVAGLKGDAETYSWTGPRCFGEGCDHTLEAEDVDQWAAFYTGNHTAQAHPVYQRSLTPEGLRNAITRLDLIPVDWPRLRWMGFLSSGNVGVVMEALGWHHDDIEGEAAPVFGELLKPVAMTDAGIVFQGLDSCETFALPWDMLGLTPVDDRGRSLVRIRKKAWYPVGQGPGGGGGMGDVGDMGRGDSFPVVPMDPDPADLVGVFGG